jgi:hypothetical protein
MRQQGQSEHAEKVNGRRKNVAEFQKSVVQDILHGGACCSLATKHDGIHLTRVG